MDVFDACACNLLFYFSVIGLSVLDLHVRASSILVIKVVIIILDTITCRINT
jgi:hypothetical protein